MKRENDSKKMPKKEPKKKSIPKSKEVSLSSFIELEGEAEKIFDEKLKPAAPCHPLSINTNVMNGDNNCIFYVTDGDITLNEFGTNAYRPTDTLDILNPPSGNPIRIKTKKINQDSKI